MEARREGKGGTAHSSEFTLVGLLLSVDCRAVLGIEDVETEEHAAVTRIVVRLRPDVCCCCSSSSLPPRHCVLPPKAVTPPSNQVARGQRVQSQPARRSAMHHADVNISAHPPALRSAQAHPQTHIQKYPLSISPAVACEDGIAISLDTRPHRPADQNRQLGGRGDRAAGGGVAGVSSRPQSCPRPSGFPQPT